jgi:hypothetical protein
MFSRKKTAAVTALLGGLALIAPVASQAYAAEAPGSCAQGAMGSALCPKGGTNYTSEDGRYRVQQTDCTPTQPLTLPSRGVLNPGSTQVGPTVTCSNTAPGPEDQKSFMD